MTPVDADRAQYLANQVALRVFRLRDALDRAQVTRETQSTLFMEITREEAWTLLKCAWDAGSFTLQFLTQIGDGFPDSRTEIIPLEHLAQVRMPERGKPWAKVCDIPLVWLGN